MTIAQTTLEVTQGITTVVNLLANVEPTEATTRMIVKSVVSPDKATFQKQQHRISEIVVIAACKN